MNMLNSGKFCQGLAYTVKMWYTTKALIGPEVALWKKKRVYLPL